MAIFWQKPLTNPFGELRFFLLFSCPQNILLYPEYHETVLFVLFCGKKKLSCLLPFPVALWLELGLAFCTTEKHLSFPSKCSKVHFPWGRTNLKEGSMGGKHSMGWDGSILFLFPWGEGWGYLSKIYMWSVVEPSIRFDIPILNIFPPIYILQLQLVKSQPFQIHRFKRVLL